MKNLIESLGITHRRFAEQFNIPYNTVAQWYRGERTAPEWVKSLIEQIIELKKKGFQIPIGKNYYMLGMKTKYGYSEYVCESKELREEIKALAKAEYNKKVDFTEKDFIEII